MHRFSSSLWAT